MRHNSIIENILSHVREGSELIVEGLLHVYHDDVFDEAFDYGVAYTRYEDDNIGMDLVEAADLIEKGFIVER